MKGYENLSFDVFEHNIETIGCDFMLLIVERQIPVSIGNLGYMHYYTGGIAEAALLNLGITFNVYGAEGATERIFPFDLMPRIIEPEGALFGLPTPTRLL